MREQSLALDGGDFMLLPSPEGAFPTHRGQIAWTVGPWVLSTPEAKCLSAVICQSQGPSVEFHFDQLESLQEEGWEGEWPVGQVLRKILPLGGDLDGISGAGLPWVGRQASFCSSAWLPSYCMRPTSPFT